MTLLEILKNVGIEEATIAKIVEEMKTNKVYTAKEENLDVRYNKLKTDAESKSQELEKAKALIEELQKDSKGNEELQGKIKAYEDQIAELQRVNEAQAIDNALDRALIEAKVNDVDYVKFKLKEKNVDGFKLGEDGKIVGLSDKLDALKVQLPNQFKSTEKVVDEQVLPKDDNNPKSITKEEFSKMNYRQRLDLYNTNKEAFDELSK